MNYRHAYHAGNFADVLKHAVLALVIQYMTKKPQALRVIDVHAGIARYDLTGVAAGKTGEWEGGIARLFDAGLVASLAPASAALLAPYLDAVRALNPDGALSVYPGSPLLARALLRSGDTLIANELHAEDCAELRNALRGEPNTKVLELDAFVALKSLLPPPGRRGVILIDPPFEATDEFARLSAGLAEALKRFATGTYVVWYPIKAADDVSRFLRQIRALGARKVLNVSLAVAARGSRPGLVETGLLIINPPYVLKAQLSVLGPVLADVLKVGQGAGFTLDDWSE
jgi:23S rRNA (adenine2030-N6)-methyltransferase